MLYEHAFRRLAAAIALAIALIGVGPVGGSTMGIVQPSLADNEEPDFLVLDPENE